ncbi:acetyltransferase [Winogradskyella sp. MIT101101]|uniref:acetyltransferase n=1 Tax=Winogradskyella sp. MIT101101 TaxID=3098297 RepID=UPI00399948F2
MLKIGIVGTGGISLEVFDILQDLHRDSDFNINENVFFIDDFDQNEKHLGLNIVRDKDVDFSNVEIVIAISKSDIRENFVNRFPKDTKYGKIIHPSSYISPSAHIGNDVIISHHCVVSSKVHINDHSHLNFHTCIGHESSVGKYFTSAPGVKISGNCQVGEHVYFGTNACTIQGIKIGSDIKVGIGTVVMKNLKKPGTYLFNPAKKFL